MGYKPPPIWVLAMYITPWKIQHFEAKVMEVDGSDDFPFQNRWCVGDAAVPFPGVYMGHHEANGKPNPWWPTTSLSLARLSGVYRRPQGSLQRDQRQNHIHASRGVGKDVLKTGGILCLKTNMSPKWTSSIGNTSSNQWFSGDMLVFRGVYACSDGTFDYTKCCEKKWCKKMVSVSQKRSHIWKGEIECCCRRVRFWTI